MRSKDDEGEDWTAVHYGKLDYVQAKGISLIYLPWLYPTLLYTLNKQREVKWGSRPEKEQCRRGVGRRRGV